MSSGIHRNVTNKELITGIGVAITLLVVYGLGDLYPGTKFEIFSNVVSWLFFVAAIIWLLDSYKFWNKRK